MGTRAGARMPSKFGFETVDDRRQQSKDQQRRHQEDQHLAQPLAIHHPDRILDVLVDLAEAHKQQLGQSQTGHSRDGRSWEISPAGRMVTGGAANALLTVALAVTDGTPSLTVTSKAGDKIPAYDIERLCRVLERETSIPTTAAGIADPFIADPLS